MQIVSNGMKFQIQIFGKNKKNIINLSFAEFAHRVVNVKICVLKSSSGCLHIIFLLDYLIGVLLQILNPMVCSFFHMASMKR